LLDYVIFLNLDYSITIKTTSYDLNRVALTRRSRRMIMQIIPRVVSQHLVSPICSKILCQTSTNLVPVTWTPRISFTWLVAMMIDAADVKPTDTGPDIKSNRNPNISIRMKNKVKLHINDDLINFDDFDICYQEHILEWHSKDFSRRSLIITRL